MRRFFALILSVLVIFSMAGCSRYAGQTDRPDSNGKCKDTGHGSQYAVPADALLDHYQGPLLCK